MQFTISLSGSSSVQTFKTGFYLTAGALSAAGLAVVVYRLSGIIITDLFRPLHRNYK